MPSVRAFGSLRMGISMSNDKDFGATDCCVRLIGWFREPVGKNCVVRGKKYLFIFVEEKELCAVANLSHDM